MMSELNLTSICGQQLAQYFKGIDYESFVNLQPDQIREAIPNVIDRIMFETRFKKFLKTHEVVSSKDTDAQGIISVCSDENRNTNYNEIDDPFFDNNFDSINVASSSAGVSKPDTEPKQLIKENIIKTVQDIIDIPDIELKIIISKYFGKEIPMENFHRIIIGKAIIHHLLVNNFDRLIARPQFISLAELVVQLFPYEEKGTYYTPAVGSLQAHGKLVAAYQNYRTQLNEAGLITRGRRTFSEESEEEDDKALEQKSDALKLVLENKDDFEQVQIAWQLCFNERQKFLNELSTFEYMRRFPAFDLLRGYELLILDADALYPDKKSKLQEIAPKIVAFASRESKKKRAPLELKSLILEYDEFIIDIDEGSTEFKTLQQLTTLRVLPHLMPNPKRKLSKTEVASFFCPYFKTPSAADKYNNKFNKEHTNTDVAFKPRLYFVGELPNPYARLRIGNHTFDVMNTIEGFDVLFKSFLALNCKYPDQSQHIWQFIKQEVYDIDTGRDKQLANVRAFIKDLKYYINNSS